MSVAMGVGWVGPEVNKFEQVSRDDYQMSLAWDRYVQRGWVYSVGWECLEGGSPNHVTHPMMHVMLPTPL